MINFINQCGKFVYKKLSSCTYNVVIEKRCLYSSYFPVNSICQPLVVQNKCFFSYITSYTITSPSSISHPHFSSSSYLSKESSDEDNKEELEDKEYEEFVKHTFNISNISHQVLIVQPYIKWGKRKKTNTTPELQLNEAVALIKTLPSWKVTATKLISLLSFDKPTIFGKGNLESLGELVTSNKNITAVFISINMLSPVQHRILGDLFKVPVFDRYTIVVQIFKLHATTKEAKLQVAMGQIPYLWSRLRHDHEGMSDKMGGGATVGGPGETYLEIKKRLLQDKERKLKNQLKKLKGQRELLRSNRRSLELPTVAVVGYTNAGKTSLIKALTKEEKLEPRNVLFATLDVTVHAGYLPSGLKVLFIDTVGFLSDIPTNLIHAFIATLEDAVQADLLIHIQDVSHPDLKAQNSHVIETLKSISLPDKLLDNMITVGNKIDLVSELDLDVGDSLPVSSTTGFGLADLKFKIEENIIRSTGQIFIKIRVPNGGAEFVWLHKESTVTKVEADEKDYEFTFVNTLISEAKLNQFKHKFIKSKVNRGRS